MRDRSRKIERILCPIAAAVLLMALTLVFFARWSVEMPADALSVNQASATACALALGVDREIAERLVSYREQARGFGSVDEMLHVPLFTSTEADHLITTLPRTRLSPDTATAGQFAAVLGISPALARRLAAYRDSLLPPAAADELPTTPTAHAVPQPTAPPAMPATLAHSEWIRHAPLLDPARSRPLLPQFVMRRSTQVLWRFWSGAGLLLLLLLFVPLWLRQRGVGGDPFLIPLALLLSGFGVAMLFSIKDPLRDTAVYEHHLLGLVVALVVMLTLARLAPVVRRRIRNYQYVWVFASALLVGALALVGSGPEGVHLNLFFFQPVEIIKVLLVFFLASYLADRAGLISDASKRWTPPKFEAVKRANGRPTFAFSLPRAQDIGPMVVMFAAALMMFYALRDLGPGLLLFATFIALLYLTTGRSSFVWIGLLLMALGGVAGYYRHVGVFAIRVDMWRAPFANAHPNGMQLGQAYWALATGGVEGSGLGLGMPGTLPRAGSDLAFVSWGEETGLLGAWLALIVYVVLVWRGLRIAVHTANDFDRALAFGLTALLGLQSLLILGGVTGLIPLTGIALPFLAYGNTALVANFAILGLLRGISSESATETAGVEVSLEIRRAARRFVLTYALVLLGVIGLGRIGWIQAVQADEIAARPIFTPDADGAVRPHLNPRLLAMERRIPRGSIYDRNGRILATSHPDEILKSVSDVGKAHRLIDSHARFYPFGPALAHLVGYLDPTVGGPFGFENGYNADLRGFAQLTDLLPDYRNKDMPWPWHQERHGRDLRLTVDAELQQRVLALLRETTSQLRDKRTGKPKNRAAFVLMEPGTGDVVVAATLPTFDPNTLTPERRRAYLTGPDAQESPLFINRAVYGVYPPGSTLKVATTACALDHGVSDLRVECNRVYPVIRWQVDGTHYARRNVRDDKGDPAFGTLTLAPAFRVSSNIYFANLAVQLGADTFRATLAEQMGFRYTPPAKEFDADLPDIGYGQGRMLASPVEMARLVAAVANEGKMMKARFVTEMTEPKHALPPTVLSQAMTAATAATLRDLMRSVVTDGTARGVFDDLGVPVAGKTGTAQNERADHEPHSWFIGFVPYVAGPGHPTPRYAFACVVENGGYGKRVAAVICRNVLRKLF
jgi:cell division protein FtsI/penicillin-binding protein 2/cell division protein FtsW (lipid II flippase)/DNA uptake protein ComE-like DNA-binding protein